MPEERTLGELLSRLLAASTIEFDNAAEQRIPHTTTEGPARDLRGVWLVSQAMYANLLAFVPQDGVPRASVAGLGGITSPAACAAGDTRASSRPQTRSST